ncbi:hypothetical protein SASPL_104562 [Salvia splendens]|uniref:Auxin responsive GH3 protein family n=1 Tax=Salvia splendens TaxID=180675 RepID=A0A8X8YI71_SALSN|nr:hypothetical protein SASPL_104562 [Salvia splendens]
MFIEEVTVNADEVQQTTLAHILSQNGDTEYLTRFKVDGPAAFNSNVPVVTFEDIQPYIRRIADGDCSPILCAQPISDFIIRPVLLNFALIFPSAQGKLIPVNKQEQDIRVLRASLAHAILKQHVKDLDEGKSLRFMFIKPDRRTQGGLVARFAITRYFKNDIKNWPDAMTTTSLYEAVCCEDIFQSMYTQTLCGLYEREQILRAIRFLQLNWQQLTHDIRNGSLDPRVDDQGIRECMAQSGSELVDLVNVEIGKEYELIVTNYNGLYRYRVGEKFRVTGFHNSAPQFRFLARRNVLLSIDTDKTGETTLQGAVESAYKVLNESKTVVADYTSCMDTTTIPGHYDKLSSVLHSNHHLFTSIIISKLLGVACSCLLKLILLAQAADLACSSYGWPSGEVVEQCCLAMEKAMDAEYRRCRLADKSIGSLEIRIVERGCFEGLMDYALEKSSAAFSQYKTPMCVQLKPMVDLLNSRVVAAYFNPAPAHWALEERL